MTAVLVTGQHEFVRVSVLDSLRSMGVVEARPSKARALTPAEVEELLVLVQRSATVDGVATPADAELFAGDMEELVQDFLAGNRSARLWGWSTGANYDLLGLWARLDADTRFLLVYEPVEFALADAAAAGADEARLDAIVDAWVSHHREMVDFHARHKARSLLLNLRAQRLTSSELKRLANTRLRLELAGGTAFSALPEAHALALLAGRELAAGHAEWRAVWSSLCKASDVADDGAPGSSDRSLPLLRWAEEHQTAKLWRADAAAASGLVAAARRERDEVLALLRDSEQELEEYARRLATSLTRSASAATPAGEVTPAVELLIDARRALVGKNWYEVEPKGRWAGPSRRSLIYLPPLAPGSYCVEFLFDHAAAPDLLDELRCRIEGVEVQFDYRWTGNPCYVEGQFEHVSTSTERMRLELEFPRAVVPGPHDPRELTAYLTSVSIRPL